MVNDQDSAVSMTTGADAGLKARFTKAAAARAPQWNQGSLFHRVIQKMMGRAKGLNAAGSDENKAWFAEVLQEAQHSPTARAALAWAEAHDVNIMLLDTGGQGMSARYFSHLGQISLYRDSIYSVEIAVHVLVHEIRHAWQDHHGLLPSRLENIPFYEGMTTTALYEADAYALQCLVQDEVYAEGPVADAQAKLEGYFKDWFEYGAAVYHADVIKRREQPNSFSGKVWRKVMPVDSAKTPNAMQWSAYIEKLGRGFAGGNYIMQSRSLRDYIEKHVLPRHRAVKGYNARFVQSAKDIDRQDRLERLKQAPRPPKGPGP